MQSVPRGKEGWEVAQNPLTTALSPEPPAISPSPSNVTLTAHIPASLPCEASGSPKPLAVWWKDGQKLDFRSQLGTYR